jgi:ankyrin repeat protein
MVEGLWPFDIGHWPSIFLAAMDDFKRFIDAAEHGDLDTVRTLLEQHPDYVGMADDSGATALHYAAFGGHCAVAKLLVQSGANINARDAKYGATPAGWAIEYLREMGAFLGIELADFAYAIRIGDVEWVQRYLTRFPTLRDAADSDGRPFRDLAWESGNAEIAKLFAERAKISR